MMLRWISLLPPPSDSDCRESVALPRRRARPAESEPTTMFAPADVERRLRLLDVDDGMEQLEDRSGGGRHGVVRHRGGEPARELRGHELFDVVAGDALARGAVVAQIEPIGQLDQGAVGSVRSSADAAPAGVEGRTPERHPFVQQQPRGDTPAVVERADDVLDGHDHVVEELLTEVHRSVHLFDLVDLDVGLMDLNDQHGEAAGASAPPSWCGRGPSRSRSRALPNSRSSSR